MLSFEEFIKRNERSGHLKHDNFYMHFSIGFQSELKRQSEYFKKLASEHPDLVESLTGKLAPLGTVTTDELVPYEREMYEAYIIMRGYGASDEELLR